MSLSCELSHAPTHQCSPGGLRPPAPGASHLPADGGSCPSILLLPRPSSSFNGRPGRAGAIGSGRTKFTGAARLVWFLAKQVLAQGEGQTRVGYVWVKLATGTKSGTSKEKGSLNIPALISTWLFSSLARSKFTPALSQPINTDSPFPPSPSLLLRCAAPGVPRSCDLPRAKLSRPEPFPLHLAQHRAGRSWRRRQGRRHAPCTWN